MSLLQEQRNACQLKIQEVQGLRWGLSSSPTNNDVMIATANMVTAAQGWPGWHLDKPSGSPDQVEASASAASGIASALDGIARALEARASDVETGMDAEAGRASAERIRALIGLAQLESAGLRILSAGLVTYAADLRGAQTDVARASGDAGDAQSSAYTFSGLHPLDERLTDAECVTAIASIDAIYADAEGAFDSAIAALDAAIAADQALVWVLSDAGGYARLSDLPTSSSTTALDAALALADGVGNPDTAIVSDAEWAAYVTARDKLTPEERARLDAALASARTPEERQIIISALASGADLDTTAALAQELKSMSPEEVAAVAGLGLPATSGGVPLATPDGTDIDQKSGTTCGSTSLLMLAAQRDPFLALLLATGRTVDGYVPPYLRGIPAIDQLGGADVTPEQRLDYIQTQIRIKSNRFTFWPGTWVGSAPWGYGDEVSEILGTDADMRYSKVGPYDDPQSLVNDAIAAVDKGTPVPFLVGPSPDSDATHVARHYVLLVGHSGDQLQFYEPSSGEVRTVSAADAMAGNGGAAFGWWGSIYGAAIPEG